MSVSERYALAPLDQIKARFEAMLNTDGNSLFYAAPIC